MYGLTNKYFFSYLFWNGWHLLIYYSYEGHKLIDQCNVRNSIYLEGIPQYPSSKLSGLSELSGIS